MTYITFNATSIFIKTYLFSEIIDGVTCSILQVVPLQKNSGVPRKGSTMDGYVVKHCTTKRTSDERNKDRWMAARERIVMSQREREKMEDCVI